VKQVHPARSLSEKTSQTSASISSQALFLTGLRSPMLDCSPPSMTDYNFVDFLSDRAYFRLHQNEFQSGTQALASLKTSN
jgi:hypothetical protein